MCIGGDARRHDDEHSRNDNRSGFARAEINPHNSALEQRRLQQRDIKKSETARSTLNVFTTE